MVRNSTKFVSYKDLKKLCADLKQIYSAPAEESGLAALEDFGKKWNGKYPMIHGSVTGMTSASSLNIRLHK
jgi:transposase-like protein